jgi:hypothetical protein
MDMPRSPDGIGTDGGSPFGCLLRKDRVAGVHHGMTLKRVFGDSRKVPLHHPDRFTGRLP